VPRTRVNACDEDARSGSSLLVPHAHAARLGLARLAKTFEERVGAPAARGDGRSERTRARATRAGMSHLSAS